MQCPRCSSPLPPESLFCPKCGKRLSAGPPVQKHRRRAKGTGSVYKLQGVRAKPWAAYADGHLVGTCATSADALALLDRYNNSKAPAALRRLSFAEVYAQWSAQHYKSVGAKSVQSYALSYQYAAPLHTRALADIGTADYQAIIDSLVAAGLSRSTCAKTKLLFNQLCQWAMTRDIITKNYAKPVELPAPPPKDTRILSEDEIALIASIQSDPQYGDAARIALLLTYTGVRINELLYIRRADVHLSERYMIGGEKTDAGRGRPIPISKEALPLVEYYLQDNTSDWLIQSPGSAAPRDHSAVRRRFRSLMQRLGIEGVTPHTCRHTAASRWAKAGVPIQITKDILGHSTIAVTSDIYTHTNAAALVAALDEAMDDDAEK